MDNDDAEREVAAEAETQAEPAKAAQTNGGINARAEQKSPHRAWLKAWAKKNDPDPSGAVKLTGTGRAFQILAVPAGKP